MRAGRALAMAALGLLASSAEGIELFRRGEVALDFSGSIRGIALATRGTRLEDFEAAAREPLLEGDPVCLLAELFEDCPAFDRVGKTGVWQSLTRVRLRFELQLSRSLSGEIEYDHELLTGKLDTLELRGFDATDEEFFLPLQAELSDFDLGGDSEGVWRHGLYRAWLNWETKRFRLILGRQRIPWGVGRLWNPIDRFNPIPPLAIEQSISQGVDSAVATWYAADFAWLDAVYAPKAGAEPADLALRLHGLVANTDYSLMAGVFDDATTFGATLERNLGEMAVHLEAVWADPDAVEWPVGSARPRELSSFWQVVVSLDTNIDVGKGIYALIEHFYDGNALGLGRGRAGSLLSLYESTATAPEGLPPGLEAALPGPYVTPIGSERLGGSRLVSFATHQTGLMLGYDITLALRGELLLIYDWNGQSSAIAPQLRYTPRGDLEITLGAQLFTGRRASQYGRAEHTGFLIVDYFF